MLLLVVVVVGGGTLGMGCTRQCLGQQELLEVLQGVMGVMESTGMVKQAEVLLVVGIMLVQMPMGLGLVVDMGMVAIGEAGMAVAVGLQRGAQLPVAGRGKHKVLRLWEVGCMGEVVVLVPLRRMV
jgi:hypothetical protein